MGCVFFHSHTLKMSGKISNPLPLQTLAYDAIDIELDLLENILPRRIYFNFLKHKFKSDNDFIREIEFNWVFGENLMQLDGYGWKPFTALNSLIFRNYFLYLLEPYYCDIKEHQLVVIHSGYRHCTNQLIVIQNGHRHHAVETIEICSECYRKTQSSSDLYNYIRCDRIMSITDINETICKGDKYWCKWCLINPLFYLSIK